MNSGRINTLLRSRSFLALWFFIIAVSVYDGFWVLANRYMIASYECNPIGQWLIGANGGDVWLLLAAKAVGTVLAAALLLLLHSMNLRIGWIVGVHVAAIQLFLLYWLVSG